MNGLGKLTADQLVPELLLVSAGHTVHTSVTEMLLSNTKTNQHCIFLNYEIHHLKYFEYWNIDETLFNMLNNASNSFYRKIVKKCWFNQRIPTNASIIGNGLL